MGIVVFNQNGESGELHLDVQENAVVLSKHPQRRTGDFVIRFEMLNRHYEQLTHMNNYNVIQKIGFLPLQTVCSF